MMGTSGVLDDMEREIPALMQCTITGNFVQCNID
ncbi:hypothetical protein Q427_05695 [Halomonas sp. BC04]|nr:hypothetical protein Q427_05695 [Halomonas sp. BC04]